MESPPGALLVVQSGANAAAPISLDGVVHVLGRAPAADIGFDNPFVSRRHAEIRHDGSGYTIRDLGSKNGTFVDGVQIDESPRALGGGEIVELGQGQVVATFALKTRTITLPADTAARRGAAATQHGDGDETITVDVAQREVYVDGSIVAPPLSRKEFDVLALLYERRGQACSKDDIAARGWPERAGAGVSDQEIGQCVHRIRRRVEPDPGVPRFIELIRGYGYRLNVKG